MKIQQWLATVMVGCLTGVSAWGQAQPSSMPAPAQSPADVVVTFYSGGSLWKTGLPGAKTGVFQGCVYEAQQQIGCIGYLDFITVRMPAGVHTFSASLSGKHEALNSQTPLLLEAGKNYYFRAEEERVAVDVVPVVVPPLIVPVPTTLHPVKGRLDVVACDVAEKETAKSRPAKGHNVGKDFTGRTLPEVPGCVAPPAAAGDATHP